MGEWVGDKFGELIQSAVEAGIGFVLWVLDLLWVMIQGLTAPQVSSDFIYLWAGRIFYISLPLITIFFIAQLLLAAVKRSGTEIAKSLTGVIIAIIGTTLSVPIVAYLTRGADGLADGLITAAMVDTANGFSQPLFGGATGSEIYSTVSGISVLGGSSGFATAMVTGAFAGIFILVVIIGALALFLALLIRTNLLYIMVVIGPLMLAGIPWRATQKWATRWVSVVVALIFTKLGVVVVMAVGSGMLTSSITAGTPMITSSSGDAGAVLGLMGQFLGASVMLIIAALTPVATFKFFDFLGEHAVEGLHAGSRAPIDAAKQAVKSQLHPGKLTGHTTPSVPVSTAATTSGSSGLAAAAGAGVGAGLPSQQTEHATGPQPSPSTTTTSDGAGGSPTAPAPAAGAGSSSGAGAGTQAGAEAMTAAPVGVSPELAGAPVDTESASAPAVDQVAPPSPGPAHAPATPVQVAPAPAGLAPNSYDVPPGGGPPVLLPATSPTPSASPQPYTPALALPVHADH